MKQILKLIILLVIGQTAFAQAPSNYTNINGRYRWIAGMFDSTFHIPKGSTPSLRTGGSTNAGALFYKTADSSLQLYTGTQWLRMLKVGDTTGMLTPYFNSVGVGLKNTGQTVYADTLLLSTRLWRNKGIDSVQANLTAGLATKLNISDTSSMLSPYARTVNVRQIVSDSLGGLVRLKALNAGGAALYANSGTKVAEWGLGGSANIDFHGFAGYDINRAGSYTVRSFTDKNYVDSAINASPSGTVTSVATNTGTGITGGTITTTGTLAIDTLLISTRAWRQKGIDSVAALANSKVSSVGGTSPISSSGGTSPTISISQATSTTDGYLSSTDWNTFNNKQNALTNPVTGTGTTNYIPKFTGTSSIGNSQIFDNGTSVGINTITPSASYKLDVNGYARASSFYVPSTTNGGGFIFESGGNSGFAIGQSGQVLQYFTSGLERMRLDASGNLGLGVTPSAWYTPSTSVLQVRNSSFYAQGSATVIASNYFQDASTIIRYIANGFATDYYQSSGQHVWRTAPSGTAGNAISFTQAMTLDASGRLGIGTTSPASVLNVLSTKTTALSTAADFLTLGATIDDNTDFANVGVGGGIAFRGKRNSGGTQTVYGAIDAAKETASGDEYRGSLRFWTNQNATGVPLERMRITSGGNVGIGTTSPTNYTGYTTLAINNATTGGVLDFMNNGTIIGQINNTASAFNIESKSTIPMIFYTNVSERMRLTSSGELLINTTSDAGDYKLQVNGAMYNTVTSGINMRLEKGTGPSIEFAKTNATAQTWQLAGEGTKFYLYDATASSTLFEIANSTGNAIFSGSIKTAAPSGYTAKPWKLGEVASTSVTLDTTRYVAVDIDGIVYYLALVTLN